MRFRRAFNKQHVLWAALAAFILPILGLGACSQDQQETASADIADSEPASVDTPLGKDRQTYTNQHPASYAVFNSITDNAAVGDERNFVRVREVGPGNKYGNKVSVVAGREYEVYFYYHNNAAANTNEFGYGIATEARAASAYPVELTPEKRGMISGFISWNYVKPQDDTVHRGQVWDEAYLTSSEPVTMRYKTGSAVIHNGGEINGSVLPEDLFTINGTYIGYDKLEGEVPGCAEYSGYITYTLIAEAK